VPGRVLAIDPGERRVGIAVSDPTGIIAQGLETFDRRVDGDLIAHLKRLVHDYDVAHIIIGNPISLSGREGEASAVARRLADQVRDGVGLRVELWDERLSSTEAHRVLAGSRADKKAVDRVAAVLILQGYLDAHPRAS
jgi:putative Holliday junction resolvase